MLQLSKLQTALCLPADARQASRPRHISARSPSPQRSSPRKTSRKTGVGFGLAVALGTLCASWPGVAAGPVDGQIIPDQPLTLFTNGRCP